MIRVPLRVLVVDDSALNRSELAQCLAGTGEAEVVGTAANGAQALSLARELKPDLITLDLEMPELDGFGFLRILPSVWRCPVVVVSSYAGNRNVFRALELGAVDFIVKPETSAERLQVFRQLLDDKIKVVRALSPQISIRRPGQTPIPTSARTPASSRPMGGRPQYLLGIAASTGGPTALTEILSRLNPEPSYAVLVAQHMPEKFTSAFAERLNRVSSLNVLECVTTTTIRAHSVLICPGRRCLEVRAEGGGYVAEVTAPQPSDRYVPSADRLLASIAACSGRQAIGLILTGMGDDGVAGAREIARRGGLVIAESAETAVVYGMPRAALQAGIAHRSLPLHQFPLFLNDLLRS
jgi:two-component system, chemotaxis family, protein-glutamate methylesterase/glutaminase